MAISLKEKFLGQARENSTTAVSVYSPPADTVSAATTTVIKTIVLCNQTTADVEFRIFLHNTGTTYDESTALYFDETIAMKSTTKIETYWVMDNPAGNLAYRTSTANALTITLFGAEIT